MLSNMASSLILHKRITTTVAKAKALRSYIEPLITKAKDDTTHSRRIVFSYLRDKYAVTELFRNVAAKIMERPGGYTRVIKLGKRQGDSAEMAMIELVDYNELLLTDKSPKKAKSTRRRRGGSKKSTVAETVTKTETAAKEEKTAAKEEPVAKTEVKSEKVAEEKAPEVKETPEVKAEEKKEEKKD